MHDCRNESHQINAIFGSLVEALKVTAPQAIALLGVAAVATSSMCSAARLS